MAEKPRPKAFPNANFSLQTPTAFTRADTKYFLDPYLLGIY
jgi:hypothetical protein